MKMVMSTEEGVYVNGKRMVYGFIIALMDLSIFGVTYENGERLKTEYSSYK